MFKDMHRLILHIDFDSFFASVEQQCNPLLRNRPIGVTAHNGRTAIIAASREAKRRGVSSPSRTFDAEKICPDILFVTADFEKYFEVSKIFLKICSDFSPVVEMFSLDEVFIDVTQTAHLFGGIKALLSKIKERIKQQIGAYVTVSIGVSYNKMLAKLGSGLDKPNGITYITKENLTVVYQRAKLNNICGIGSRIELRLHVLGIHTLLELRDTPLGLLIKEFGPVEGHFLHNVGMGRDVSIVNSYTKTPDVKSVSRNYALPHNEYDFRIVIQNVYELCEEIGIKLRRLGKKAQAAGVFLHGDVSLHAMKTKRRYFDTGDDMFAFFRSHLDPLLEGEEKTTRGRYIRQISVWAGDLVDANSVTQPLFPQDRKKERIVKIIDNINDKFGDHTIRNGFVLYSSKLKTVPNGWGADRYERMKLAKGL